MKLFFRTASRRGRGAFALGRRLGRAGESSCDGTPGGVTRASHDAPLPGRVAVWAAAGLLALALAGPLGAQTIATERMFEAVMKDDLAAVKRQVEAGAEIRWRNPRGLTAAEFAVELGHIEIANYLLAEEKSRVAAPARVADKGAPKAAKKVEPPRAPRPDAGAARTAPVPDTPPRAQRAPQTLVERLANLMRPDESEPGPEPPRAGTETSPTPPAPDAPAAQDSPGDELSPAERIAERVRERQEVEKKTRAAAPAPTEERRTPRSRSVVEWLADLWAGREPRETTRPRLPEELAASEDARGSAPPPPDRPTPGVRDPWAPQVSPATPSIAPAPDSPAPEIPPSEKTAPESPAPQPPAPTALAALPPQAPSPAPPSGTPTPEAPAGAWAPTIERGGEAQAAPSEAPTAGPQDAPTLFARRKDGPPTKKDAAKELGAPAPGAQQTARLGEPKKAPAGEGGPGEGGLWGSKVEMAQARPVVTAPPAAPPVPEAVPTGLGFMVGRSLNLDKTVPPRGDAQEVGRGCIEKARGAVVFCVEVANWPQAMEADFSVNTILYTGQQAVIRYDQDKATRMQTLFPSDSFDKVVAYYSGHYGPPAQYFTRSIAPLASARRENPTRAWRARNPKTGQIATLEIRKFDDTRGGFPDTRRGVVMLYYQDTPPIFPQVSALELMRLKRPPIPKPDAEGGDDQSQGLFGLPGTAPGPAARAQ